MGANNSQLSTIQPFDKDQWYPVPLIPFTNIKDPLYGSNFRILANNSNAALEIQKYDLYFNSYKQYSSYREFISWRNNCRFTVQVRYVSEPQKQNICACAYQGSIYIERIPIRLVQIYDLSVQEGLCILNAASQGFQELFQKYRYFQIKPEQICFTKDGQVKLWVNKNLSQNLPQTVLNSNRRENYELFMQKLITIVQDVIDFEDKPSIRTFIQLRRIQNPYGNIHKTLEQYTKFMKAKVPRYLAIIRNLCQNDVIMNSKAVIKRNSLAYYQSGKYRNSLSFKPNSNKLLSINQQVVNLTIKSSFKLNNMAFAQPFRTQKKQNSCQHCKNTISNSTTLTKVRFSYKDGSIFTSNTSSERISKNQEQTFVRSNPFNTPSCSQFISPNQQKYSIDNKKPRYLSIFQDEQLGFDKEEGIKVFRRS